MLKQIAAVSVAGALMSPFGLTKCDLKSPPPPPPATHAPPGHRATQPATPVPGGPQQGKPFPGNVRLTFWVTASAPVDVIYSIGSRHESHGCDRSCHWDDTAKPEQKVVIVVGPREKGNESGRAVEVVQANNGFTVCKDDNYDRHPMDSAHCEGVVKI